MSVVEIGVSIGGIVAIGILAWFFFGPPTDKTPEPAKKRQWF